MRESPSVEVVEHLEKLGVDYTAYDPHIKQNNLAKQTQSLEEAVNHADLIVILTDHNEFKTLDPKVVEGSMRTKMIFDTKNCIDRTLWEDNQFDVFLLGDSKHSEV
jgi:UDP-N-acetyl-D-mannosaminuronic acid dehydrogenase